MKTNLFKLYLLAFFLLNDILLFAQPGQDQPGGGLEGEDPPLAPINGKILWLVFAGILFALYSYRSKIKETA